MIFYKIRREVVITTEMNTSLYVLCLIFTSVLCSNKNITSPSVKLNKVDVSTTSKKQDNNTSIYSSIIINNITSNIANDSNKSFPNTIGILSTNNASSVSSSSINYSSNIRSRKERVYDNKEYDYNEKIFLEVSSYTRTMSILKNENCSCSYIIYNTIELENDNIVPEIGIVVGETGSVILFFFRKDNPIYLRVLNDIPLDVNVRFKLLYNMVKLLSDITKNTTFNITSIVDLESLLTMIKKEQERILNTN